MNHHHTFNLSFRLNGLATLIGFLTMYAFGCGSGAGDATPATGIKHDAAVKRDTALAAGGTGGGTVAVATGGSGGTTDIASTGGTGAIIPDAATSRDLPPDLVVDSVRIVGAETSTAPMDATVEAQRDTADGGRDGAGGVPDSPSDPGADLIADVAPDLARDLPVDATTDSDVGTDLPAILPEVEPDLANQS